MFQYCSLFIHSVLVALKMTSITDTAATAVVYFKSRFLYYKTVVNTETQTFSSAKTLLMNTCESIIDFILVALLYITEMGFLLLSLTLFT